jgi:3-oxoacyl-[acyl-carrier-protein] synthase II
MNTTYARAAAGESGIRRLTRFNPEGYGVKAAGEIPDFSPRAYEFLTDRELHLWHAGFIPLVMALCYDLVQKTKLVIDKSNAHRIGAFIGSAMNGNDALLKNFTALNQGSPLKVSPFCLPNICANMPAGKASMLLGFKGPVMSPATACASGNHCIAEAAKIIQRGDADVMFAGGVELPLLPVILYGFGNMRALATEKEGDRAFDRPEAASRPYSGDRRGFVLAEGGGILLLSSLDFAEKHALPILAEVVGQHMNSDASHYTNPSVDAIATCVKGAVEDADLTPDDIEYINGHGTSTKVGDSAEIECLRKVFGDRLPRIPISSNKSQIGHSLAASAAIEAALTVTSMQHDILLPTINYQMDKESSDLDFVPNEKRASKITIALSNSFGFGGTNCCIVLRNLAS